MSSNYLPEMEMPPEPTEEKPIVEEEGDPLVSKATADEGSVKMEITENVNEETGEENPNFEYSDEEVIEEDEPVPVKQKKKLQRDEVFKTPQVMAVNEPVKEKKKRKPPSEKQLAALAKARENMRIKREEAKKLKAEGKEAPVSKRKARQKKEVQEEVRNTKVMFSEEQVAKITADALSQYEEKRKVRKAQKAVIKEKEEQELKVQRQVQRAMGQPAQDDIWGQALAGLI
tara:strand:- start:3 stop:692 length:690 start_codon:yes stop_codon:yes gene_type:complete